LNDNKEKKKVEDQSSRDLMVMATKLFGVFTTSKQKKKNKVDRLNKMEEFDFSTNI
jgi:hypothetical protein